MALRPAATFGFSPFALGSGISEKARSCMSAKLKINVMTANSAFICGTSIAPCLFLSRLPLHFAQNRKVHQTIERDFGHDTRFLPDFIDDRFQDRFFDIAVRIDDLSQ